MDAFNFKIRERVEIRVKNSELLYGKQAAHTCTLIILCRYTSSNAAFIF